MNDNWFYIDFQHRFLKLRYLRLQCLIVCLLICLSNYASGVFDAEEGEQDQKTVHLQEVVVKPKKVKYSKKNNPAVDFINYLRKEAKNHDPARSDFYSYDKYEKTLFALNDFQKDLSKDSLTGKKSFLTNYVDTSSWTGNRLLDLMLKEKKSTRIRSRNPGADKEITEGYRSEGIDEVFNQDNVRIIMEDAIREIDIYGNDITILQNRFVSPLSSIGPDFYKYYLKDTVYVGDERCIELGFVPHNVESMGFSGNLYVPLDDTTMFVKKVTMRTPADINLNYVESIYINQSFEKDSLGNRHKTYDDVCIEFQIAPHTPRIYGRKTTTYDNFSYEMRKDLESYYKALGKYFSLEDATRQPKEYWDHIRPFPLSYAESRMGTLTKDMRKVPVLYWGEKLLRLLESGYITTGKQSKVDLGPINTFISGSALEGLRIRLGGMTMAALNPHLFGSGYVAYGLHDRKWKYEFRVDYSFKAKKSHANEWPRHGLYALYTYDVDMIGQHYLFTSQDNVFLSLKRKKSVLVTYRRKAQLGYILELPNNFSVGVDFRDEKQEASHWLPFMFRNGEKLRSYKESSFGVTLRWAPGERFVQGRTKRSPVNMDAWIFQFTHELGPKGLCGASFTLNRSEVSIQKRLWLSAFGYANIILKGGIIWSSVYYPALMWPNANLSYTIQPESYSLMNPMEFANDRYGALDVSYFGNGVLFNRIPLIKKLKLREVLTFKGLVGGLSDRNNPNKNNRLLLFPYDAHTSVMKSTPYMELGIGIDNILTVLRVDYVWRLTYRGLPGCDNGGLRVGLHLSF